MSKTLFWPLGPDTDIKRERELRMWSGLFHIPGFVPLRQHCLACTKYESLVLVTI